MTWLLHLKHWQLFVLLIGAPMAVQIITVSSVVKGDPSGLLIAFPLLMLLYTALYFGWFYAMGTELYKKLPATVPMKLTRFKIFLLIPVVYLLLIMAAMGFAFNNPENVEESFFGYAGLIIPLHLFSMSCIFYCLYFVAKALKAVEWQRPVTFGDFAGEFFLIWFFPVGVWIIQPRINRLFNNHAGAGGNLVSHPL